MEEVRIHSGSRIKLKRVDESALPRDFVVQLREYAHKEERIEAVFLFALQSEDREEQLSMAIALKSGFFAKNDETFLQVVDEVQMLLPAELPMNLYRFGAAEQLARYCAHSVEPLYLRRSAWLEKQRKKLTAQ